MGKLKLFLSLLFVALFFQLSATESGSKYISPINFGMKLSGNFGEIRSTHFHTGIDIKTDGVEGKEVRSVADGYVSRIYVSGYGYGNALYITHPKLGTMTVYGHLSSFSPAIKSYVEAYQYRNKRFNCDLYPPKEKFVVKQREVVALSGNSGSSGGPHIHFEVRSSNSGMVLDPIAVCKYSVLDTTPPTIFSVRGVELDYSYQIPIHTPLKPIEAQRVARGHYKLAKDTIFLAKEGYLAFEIIEKKDGVTNIYGTRSMSLECEGQKVWGYSVDALSFSYGNGVTNIELYPETTQTRNDIIKTYISPFNSLRFYTKSINDGIISLSSLQTTKKYKLTASDEVGNSSVVEFFVALSPDSASVVAPPKGEGVRADKYFSYSDSVATVTFKPHTLRESTFIDVSTSRDEKYPLSMVVNIESKHLIVSKSGAITIKPNSGVDQSLLSKLSVAKLSEATNNPISCNGIYKNGVVTALVSTPGRYVLVSDTTPPVVTPKWSSAKAVSSYISYKITDNLSGILGYSATIDGKWALFEYDPKTATIKYNISANRLEKGKTHTVKLNVWDAKNNTTSTSHTFIW